VLVVGRTDHRLGLARELGAEATIVGKGEPLAAAARRLSGRDGVDLVIETAGTAEAVELSVGQVGFVRPGGRVILTGLPHDPARIEFFWIVRREIDIRGSMIYRGEFEQAVSLLAEGRIRVDALLTHRFPLTAIDAALAAHRDRASIKVAIFPDGSAG
jgi:L-iditol 2-dehydrogenase